jgi:excisionase family DNA binding protein
MENTKKIEKRGYTVQETADYLGISVRTVYNEMSRGTFPIKPRRWGRKPIFRKEDLDRLLDTLST